MNDDKLLEDYIDKLLNLTSTMHGDKRKLNALFYVMSKIIARMDGSQEFKDALAGNFGKHLAWNVRLATCLDEMDAGFSMVMKGKDVAQDE